MRSKGHGEDPSKSEQVETRYRVLARTISARGRNLVLGAVLACNLCLLARTRVVEFRSVRTGK